MPPLRPSTRFVLFLGIAVFLAIFGGKLLAIGRFGSDLPYWDQWPGEGMNTIQPWFERHEFWGPLFTGHNEHRIAPTRLLSLGLLLIGGQWDARVQCVANAGLHASMIVAFLWWVSRRVTVSWLLFIALLLTMLASTPIVWENVLAGFQSQFYFLIAFSWLGMGGVLSSRAGSLRWALGAFACFVAVVSMGSGMLCGAPLIFVSLAQVIFRREERHGAWINLTLGIAICAVGALLYIPAPHHASMRPQSALQFLSYFVRCLAWPWYDWPWMALVFWAPWVVLVIGWIRDFRIKPDATNDILIACGLWVLAQAAAVSFSRGGASLNPSIRYGDVTGLGVTLGLVIMALLAVRHPMRWRAAAGVYAALLILTAFLANRAVFAKDLYRVKGEFQTYEANVQAFLLTHDESHLRQGAIPFPWPTWLRDQLKNPTIERILPASVRPPIPVTGFLEFDEDRLGERPIKRITSGTRWESAPLPAGNGWWKIETTGDLGNATPEASLTLVSASTGIALARIAPTKHASDHWRAAYVPVPTEPFRIVATTTSQATFAFSQPIAVSSLSYWVFRLIKEGRLILFCGMFLFIPASLALKRTQIDAPVLLGQKALAG